MSDEAREKTGARSELPAKPNLEHLKKQARALLTEALEGDAAALSRLVAAAIVADAPKLADALHVIAREYGFDTWPLLKLHVEANSVDAVEALTAAVKANDAALVRGVLTRHASLRLKIDEPLPGYGFDAPALFGAVNHGNREMVDALLDSGADINARTRWWAGGFGVLDSANLELAQYLISRGAVVDIHAAARLGMVDRVRELLSEDKTLLSARGGDGQLPLHFASTVEIAEMLLDSSAGAGADIDAIDVDHESTAVQYMVSIKPYRHEVAKHLISRGAKVDIFAAAALGDLALVERILNDDPETVRMTVNERHFPKRDPRAGGSIYVYGFGFTKSPHMVAHQFGHQEVFELLMQRSAPWLRLLLAAEIGDEALAARIYEQHPQVIQKMNRFAALRIIGVAFRNNARAVELLLSYGWPAEGALENGQTALHSAAWHGNLAMVHSLLKREAPVNVFEKEHGGSPLAWALHGSLNSWERAKGDYVGVAVALLEAGAEVPKPEGPLVGAEEVLEVVRRWQSRPIP